MLTREQAKTKQCPYLIQADTYAFINGSNRDTLCTAEQCPKWADESPDNFLCEKRKSCNKVKDSMGIVTYKEYIKHCNHCPKRFGRCGG